MPRSYLSAPNYVRWLKPQKFNTYPTLSFGPECPVYPVYLSANEVFLRFKYFSCRLVVLFLVCFFADSCNLFPVVFLCFTSVYDLGIFKTDFVLLSNKEGDKRNRFYRHSIVLTFTLFSFFHNFFFFISNSLEDFCTFTWKAWKAFIYNFFFWSYILLKYPIFLYMNIYIYISFFILIFTHAFYI